MRRVVAIAVSVLLAVAVAPRLLTSGARASSDYRVDAIFDTAKGVISGQLVKIAGARVGAISDVTLTPDYKARIEMTVDRRFAPFHADASCSIKPEGLIAENFVQCDPGTPDSPALVAQGDNAPTVPVSHTSAPVTLNDLFDIWNVPTVDRLTLLVNELGAAGAGRGEDINSILRRSNPALAAARRAIGVLNSEHDQLAGAIHSTNVVIAALASPQARVGDLVDRTAAVTGQTAARRTQLADAVHQLPGMLAAARPALGQLDALTRAGRPLLDNLYAAAPGLNRLVGDVAPFSAAAQPTVSALSADVARARPAVSTLTPVAGQLATFARAAVPTSSLVDQEFTSLRDRGFVEGLLSFLYFGTASTARFDATSHFLTGLLSASSCSLFATHPAPGCSANFTGGFGYPAAKTAHRGASRHSAAGAPAAPSGSSGAPKQAAGGGGGGGSAPALPKLPTLPQLPRLPQLPQPKLPLPSLPTPTVPSVGGGSGSGSGSGPAPAPGRRIRRCPRSCGTCSDERARRHLRATCSQFPLHSDGKCERVGVSGRLRRARGPRWRPGRVARPTVRRRHVFEVSET